MDVAYQKKNVKQGKIPEFPLFTASFVISRPEELTFGFRVEPQLVQVHLWFHLLRPLP